MLPNHSYLGTLKYTMTLCYYEEKLVNVYGSKITSLFYKESCSTLVHHALWLCQVSLRFLSTPDLFFSSDGE